jgi:HTH-type transcriptional regulator / antitoxin HigA
LKEIESLMMAAPDTPEGEKLDVMVTLIEAFEAKHFPMDLPGPVEATKFEMERKGLTVKDLEPMIGKSNRVYEILIHKRSFSLKMAWKLRQGLGIPAESLIKPPRTHAKQNLRYVSLRYPEHFLMIKCFPLAVAALAVAYRSECLSLGIL